MTDEERALLAAHVVKVAHEVSEATAPIVSSAGLAMFFVLLPLVREDGEVALMSSPFVASSLPAASNEGVAEVLRSVADAMADTASETHTSVHRVGSKGGPIH